MFVCNNLISYLQPFCNRFRSLPFCLKQTVWSSRRRVQLRPEPDGRLSSGTLLERDRNGINSSGKNDGNTLLRALWSHRLWGRRDLRVSYALVHSVDQGDPVFLCLLDMTCLPGNLRGVPNHDNHRVDQLADCYDVGHLLQNTGAGELKRWNNVFGSHFRFSVGH